jgi:glycosyltransferase involved in cell wall biosynthesis
MVHSCIKDSEAYSLDYFSLDQIDVPLFAATGQIKLLAGNGTVKSPEDYDFWVFNWHFVTMASLLDPASVARLPGRKYTVVLELTPEDPLKLVPPNVFDGFIALDPAAPQIDGIFPFPRPLQGAPLTPAPLSRPAPVIGSFGFGTPGKGFELLVEAVNREFDAAVVRVNIPRGTYVSTDVIHNQDYAKYIETTCKRIAKPGIEIRFTYDFMSAEELVDWCADNDLNCFMYTRCQPGLSATTDQAIISGRPLLTLSNDTFRHIQAYIPPYPATTLRQAIETTVPAVKRLQHDWSREAFNRTFHRMLVAFGDIPADERYGEPIGEAGAPPIVMVASGPSGSARDVLDYATRLGDSIGRSAKFQIVRVECISTADLADRISEIQPSAVIVADMPGADPSALVRTLRAVKGPTIVLAEKGTSTPQAEGALHVVDRRPIIPFLTVTTGLGQAAIHLVGFAPATSNLEVVVDKIARERPGSAVLIETPAADAPGLESRVRELGSRFPGLDIRSYPTPSAGAGFVAKLAEDSLAIFYADPARMPYLESLSALAMTTERAVAYTRAAPFPAYGDRGTYVEDAAIPELIASGMAAHVRLLNDFGEWRIAAEIHGVLSGKVQARTTAAPPVSSGPVVNAEVDVSASQLLAIQNDEDFLYAAYKALLRRAPDPDGLRGHLTAMRKGSSRGEVLVALSESAEGRMRKVGIEGLDAVIRQTRQSRRSLIVRGRGLKNRLAGSSGLSREERIQRAKGAISVEDILAHRGVAFVEAAYETVLGRSPDPAGLRHHLTLLLQGESRARILINLRSSPEGVARGACIPGFAALQRRHRLMDTPILGPVLRRTGWSAEKVDVTRTVRALENQVQRLWEARTPPTPAPAPAPVPTPPAATPIAVQATASIVAEAPLVPAERLESASTFLLAGSAGSRTAPASAFTARLHAAWNAQGSPSRLVFWDAEARHLRLATRDEFEGLGLGLIGDGYPEAGDPRAVIAPSSCRPGDWLLAPEPPEVQPGESELVDLNLILEARRLGLKSAYVFHGAEPLRQPRCAGPIAEAHERHMQALLLADLILPVSASAATDLNDVFVQHQRASFVPPTRETNPPVPDTGTDDDWIDYTRQLKGAMADAGDISRQMSSLYYWIDAGGAESPAGVFALELARALKARGVAVTPVAWDRKTQRLVAAKPVIGAIEAGAPWAPWVAPDDDDAPRWLLVPDQVQPGAVDELAAFAADAGLRLAAILHESGHDDDAARERARLEALTQFDKVLAVSESRFDAFQGFLLSWRGKLHSAEHRFKMLAAPDELAGRARRSAPKPAQVGVVRVAIWTPSEDRVEQAVLFDAAARAAARSSDRLLFTFIGQAPRPAAKAKRLNDRIGAIEGAAWQDLSDGVAVSRVLDEADFTVSPAHDGSWAAGVRESLWRALPCLVGASPETPSAPGLATVDMTDADAVGSAMLRLTEPGWRRALAHEILDRPIQSWNDYATALSAELAADRATDSLIAPNPAGDRDLYADLVNLRRRPKLSICISTYRRAGWLGVNLRNIFRQIPTPHPDLEVLVVDNASPDNTPEVVQPYLGRADFRYLRNPKNVGMLGNLAVTAQRARGEYVWILGDDDLTRDGAIEKVLKILDERPQTELIYLNYGYTSEPDPSTVTDLDQFLNHFNILEPDGPDVVGSVSLIAAKNENFYTAIYSHVYRRDHAMRSYCQDTSGRIFSTMVSCIPTAYYVLNYMSDAPAYWIGEPSMVVNSNVSWADYGPMLDLEHLPRAWDAAERAGTPPVEVDQRRANRLWLVEMMWRDIFENDKVGNSAYVSPPRVLMRLKHLEQIDKYIPEFRAIYERAHVSGHPAAAMAPERLFSAFQT